MGEIAAQYVSIYPKFASGFATEIQSGVSTSTKAALDKTKTDSAAGGKQAGKSFGESFKTVAAPLLAVASVGMIADLVRKSVDTFSELEDATGAASVVFGDSMKTIIDQSEKAATTLGMSKQQVIDAANTFGTFGKSAGLAGNDLANFSVQMTQIAGDLSSFKGGSPEEAIDAVGAALRGETEPIRRYGVLLDDASLRQQALKMHLIETTKNALTPQQRVLAAQALILAQTSDAQGDFARTASSTANTQKTLAAESANLSAELGQKLAPAIVAAQKAGIGMIQWVTDNQAALVPFAGTLSVVVAGILGLVGAAKAIEALKAAKVTLSGLGDALQGLGIKARAAGAGLAAGAGVIGIALAAAATVYSVFADANSSAQADVDDFTEALKASNGVIDDNVRATAAKSLQDSGAFDAAKKMGVALPDLTDAVLGNADAYNRVQMAMQAWWPDADRASAWLWDPRWANLQKVNGSLGELGTKFANSRTSAANQATALGDVTTATNLAANATDNYTNKTNTGSQALKIYDARLKLINGALSTFDAQTGFQQAIDAATAAVKKNGRTLNDHTKAGRANRDALSAVAKAGLDVVQSLKDQNASDAKVKAAMKKTQAEFVRVATAMTGSKEAAIKLAEKLNLIPTSKKVTIKSELDPSGVTKWETYNPKTKHTSIVVGVSMNKSADEIVYNVAGHGNVKFTARARGGAASGLTLLGEEGPELVDLPSGSYVYTATRTAAMLQRSRANQVGVQAAAPTQYVGPTSSMLRQALEGMQVRLTGAGVLGEVLFAQFESDYGAR